MRETSRKVVQQLRELRRSERISQRELAQRMGVGQSVVSVFESTRHEALPSTVEAYARALGVEVVGEFTIVAAGTGTGTGTGTDREECMKAHPAGGGGGGGGVGGGGLGVQDSFPGLEGV